MTLDANTKTVETYAGITDSTNVISFLANSTLTKSQAHKLLDEVKAGITHHPLLVTQALITTGDWYER